MIEEILEEISNRRSDSHKYENGHLLVIGGSRIYSGSPAFNSLAAYRSGVDLVTTAAPERAAEAVASFSPSLITYPLEGDHLRGGHLKEISQLAESADAVVLGGGLGRSKETYETVTEFLSDLGIPAVIDADGIHAVAEQKEALKENSVLTPHSREFEVLAEKPPNKDNAKAVAKEMGCTILLKRKVDIVTNGNKILENETGNEYMTVGGTGDTLAGICGSLLAQGLEPVKAAYGAAWINGKAGEIASEGKGVGIIPDDLVDNIPEAMREV